jgi:hypothetical protein
MDDRQRIIVQSEDLSELAGCVRDTYQEPRNPEGYGPANFLCPEGHRNTSKADEMVYIRWSMEEEAQ